LGNPDDEMISNFSIYADNLGLAFQIADDILDVTGNPEELGKHTGQDSRDSKNTYTSINGLDNAYKKLDDLSNRAKEAISSYYDNAEFFSGLVDELKTRKN